MGLESYYNKVTRLVDVRHKVHYNAFQISKSKLGAVRAGSKCALRGLAEASLTHIPHSEVSLLTEHRAVSESGLGS